MRIARLLIGIVVVVVALWTIVGEQMTGASANAVVNAEVVTLRADVAGDLTLPLTALGTRVARGEVVAAIDDPLVDTVRLDDLRMELALATADAAHAQAMLEQTTEIRAALVDRTGIYRQERLTELRARLEHARNRLAVLESSGAAGVSTGITARDLEQRVVAALDTVPEPVPSEPVRYQLTLEHARERVEVLEIAVRAAERNVFLGDGYNDAPNAEQRAVELESAVRGHKADLTRAEVRVAAVTARLDRAHARVAAAAGGEIASPVNGIYWEVLQADGVTVQRGDPILRLVDCDSTFVTLSVTERIYNRLTVGQPARFRMQGDSRVFDGTVTRLAGSGAATIYRNIAVAPSQRHLERYDVLLRLPGLNADPELGCAIGRTGRVFFEPRPLDWLRGIAG